MFLQGKQETLQSFWGKCLSKHTHMHAHTQTHARTETLVHAHTHTHHTHHTHTHSLTHSHTCTHTHNHTCTHAHIHAHTPHTHTPHTHTHTHTHKHTHTRAQAEYHISNCRLSHLKLQSIISQKTVILMCAIMRPSNLTVQSQSCRCILKQIQTACRGTSVLQETNGRDIGFIIAVVFCD